MIHTTLSVNLSNVFTLTLYKNAPNTQVPNMSIVGSEFYIFLGITIIIYRYVLLLVSFNIPGVLLPGRYYYLVAITR